MSIDLSSTGIDPKWSIRLQRFRSRLDQALQTGRVVCGMDSRSEVNLRTQEHCLWAVVLCRGISSAKISGDVEDLDWLRDEEEDRIGSFIWICELLDLNPVAVRKAVESEDVVRKLLIITRRNEL